MRLITKTIIYYLIASVPVLAIAGLFGYSLIKNEMNDALNEYLMKEKQSAEKLIRTLKEPRILYLSTDSLSKAIPVADNKKGLVMADSVIYDQYEEEELNYRILKSHFEHNGQNYLILIAKSTMEDDDVVESLYKAFGLIMLLLVLAFFLLSWILSKTLWRPFYKIIEQLGLYDIKTHAAIKFDTSSTKEFKQLSLTLNEMMDKLYADYLQQKEFTENASHEMQTPLAVIKANLNLLMQSPKVGPDEMAQIEVIDNTIKKLTSLNKALLLLSKIENNQFNEVNEVNLNERIQRALENYREKIDASSIQVDLVVQDEAILNMNSTLADILITNLVQNALRHNQSGGIVKIEVAKHQIVVSNSGSSLSIKPEELFVRFKKNDASKESLGLGLSIVKSIVKLYNFEIDYAYVNSLHTFTLKF